MAPEYLSTYCQPVSGISGRRHLRSADSGHLDFPRVKLASYGRRSFVYAGPSNWNSLPAYLRDSSLSLSYFKHHLKTFFFSYTHRVWGSFTKKRAIWIHCYYYRAMRCIRAVFAVTRCPSVCLSVTFRSCAKTDKDIFEMFSQSGSDTILVFPYQRGCRYSDGNLPPSNARGYDKMTIFSQISRCISETVIVRWAHAARQFVSIEFSFHPYNI